MKLPAFAAEMARDENRPKLQVGVWTGYVTAAALFLLAFVAQSYGLVAEGPWLYALIGAKVATNTLAWASLRLDKLVLELSGLNTFADIVLITGAIYFTGGQVSPLLPVYFVETAVMAMLTNVGLTVVTVVLSFLLYAAMVVAVQLGAIPQMPAPIEVAGSLTATYTICNLLLVALVLFAPGAYMAIIVQRLRQRESALEEQAADLIEASKAKSQFIANVTHELRTPLHGILGVTEIVEEGIYGPVTDKQRDGLGSIRHSARNLLELIDAILMLARVEASRLDVRVAPTNVGEMITAVISTGRWMLGTKPLAIETDVAPDLPEVLTDRALISQVLLNLLSNAIKFTAEGGRVRVVARREAGGGVTIAVEDTGVGIPPAELERIFEEFHQVDGSAARDYGGAGIGLALVRRLASRLGARVTVKSTEGSGSTFTLHLPDVAPVERRSSRPPTAPPAPDPTPGATPG